MREGKKKEREEKGDQNGDRRKEVGMFMVETWFSKCPCKEELFGVHSIGVGMGIVRAILEEGRGCGWRGGCDRKMGLCRGLEQTKEGSFVEE